jgi:hypothetical protein
MNMVEQQVQSFPSHHSLEIQELAITYRLGALVATYRGGFTRNSITGITIGVFFAMFSVSGIIISIATSRSTPMDFTAFVFLLLVVLVPFVLPTIVILWLSIGRPLQRRRHWRVYVFNHGFIFTTGQQPDIFRWDEIRTIWWEEDRYYREWTPTIHIYTIDRFDGHRIVLDNKIHKVKELGTIIGEQVANALWPQTLAVLNAGNIIHFGPLNVSRQGISKGDKFLPWPALKEIVISGEDLKIHQHGKWLSWSNVELDNVPNVFLLLALSRFVMGR